MTVWCLFIDNGPMETPSLVDIFATKELADAEVESGYTFAQEWEVTDRAPISRRA